MSTRSVSPVERSVLSGTEDQNTSQENREIAGGLLGSALLALRWNYAGALTRMICQFVIIIVLARILGPEPFGLVAAAWVIIGLGNLVADFGFGAALVQQESVTEEAIRSVFTLQLIIGATMTALVAASAGLLADVFDQSALAPVIRVLSLVFVIQAFGQTSFSLLKRNLDFKKLQIAQVSSYLASFLLLGIPLALVGFGVWSLVAAQISQVMLYAVLAFRWVRHPIRPLLDLRAGGFFGFGSKVVGVNLLNWSIISMDSFFVGKFFGMVQLGLYNRAYTLMVAPMNSLVTVLQQVLFSASSRSQHDVASLKRGYLASASVVALVTVPVFCCVALVPGTVIEGLYGDRWLEAVPLLAPLALAMPFHAVMAIAGPIVWGKGQVGRELRVQALVAALLLAILLLTSRISMLALVWGVFAAYVVRSLLMTWTVQRSVSGSWIETLRAVRGGMLVAAFASPVVFSVDSMLQNVGVEALLRLLLDASAGAAAGVVCVLTLPGLVLHAELVKTLGGRAGRLPAPLRWLLKRAGLGKYGREGTERAGASV